MPDEGCFILLLSPSAFCYARLAAHGLRSKKQSNPLHALLRFAGGEGSKKRSKNAEGCFILLLSPSAFCYARLAAHGLRSKKQSNPLHALLRFAAGEGSKKRSKKSKRA
jgi:hypothetical protein